MVENKITPIENSNDLCWKCLQHKDHIHKFVFGDLGYGSSFDCWGSQIQLCDGCLEESNPTIWDFEEIDTENIYGGHYKYEDEIFEYIKSLPIQSRELFYNETCFGCDSYSPFTAQDWIDYDLNILPHDKCKEYGVYSPEERQAFADRFPICDKVKRYVYSDKSAGCHCDNHTFGNEDGSCGLNISDNCYMCDRFEIRKDSIETINVSEEFLIREQERLNDMIKYATTHLKMSHTNPDKYVEDSI